MLLTHRFALLGMDMSLADYDGRTALHLASAEGHAGVVKFLLEKCKVSPHVVDRYVCILAIHKSAKSKIFRLIIIATFIFLLISQNSAS